MNQTDWSRGYLVVAALAVALIPLAVAAAAATTENVSNLSRTFESDLPTLTEIVIAFGAKGFFITGGACLATIMLMAIWRKRFVSLVVSALLVFACVAFCLVAMLSALLSFIPLTTVLP